VNLALVFASQPLYGQVLPGLVPPLQPFQAALLYHAMLRDQLRACAALPDTTVRICFAPGLLPGSLEGDFQWEIQRGQSLPERLASAFESAFRSRPAKVLALGFEARFYSSSSLAEAFAALDTHSVVTGPGLAGFKRLLPSMLKVEPHRYRGLAGAFSLTHQSLEAPLNFESMAALAPALKKNPEIAPLCAMALAAMA
jgi:glycosyltransferase A (GT-A) superfamily protein (DUF2064 family)